MNLSMICMGYLLQEILNILRKSKAKNENNIFNDIIKAN